MAIEKAVAVVAPEGEQELVVIGGPNQGSTVDTFGGTIHVKWDETAAVTPFGQLAFFIEFLKTAGLWDGWVNDCPVAYESPNAPARRTYWAPFCCPCWQDIGGTHISRRYASTE